MEAKAEEAERSEQLRLEGQENTIPDAVIGRALTTGSNEQHSIERIVAYFQRHPADDRSADFLRDEYGTGGKGITIAGKAYSLWFDGQGLRIARGKTVETPDCTTVTWDRAASLIEGLLQNGTYATQEKIDQAENNAYRELSLKLWYIFRDLTDEAKEQGHLATLQDAEVKFTSPEGEQRVEKLLRNVETRSKIADEVQKLGTAYDEKQSVLRFRPAANLLTLFERITDFYLPTRVFQATPDFAPARASFITQDEVDRLLRGSDNNHDGRLRTYSFFARGYNAKECADYLKDGYGTGGQSNSQFDVWYDSKGIRYRREDEYTGFKGYATIQLNWNQVQKRIRQLIDEGRFLSEQDRKNMTRYERLQLARRIYSFQYNNPNNVNRTYPHKWDTDAAEKQILPILDDPEKSAALYDEMVKAMAAVSPDDRAYAIMEPAMRDMATYIRGEYSLFTPLSDDALQAERQERERKADEHRKNRLDEDEIGDEFGGDTEESGTLAAAAKALARKQQVKSNEQSDGQ